MADAERRVQSMPHQRLDRDPSRLTTFPVPGFLAPTFQELGSNAVSSETSKPVASPVKIRPPPMSAGNQYWMPDHLCKTFLIIKKLTSIQSFVGCLPGYFRYMASIYFDGRASLLSKTVGLYQTTITRKDSGQKTVQYICVMENAFYQKQLTRTYDLKGSSRNRFAKPRPTSEAHQNDSSSHVLLDGNFLEFTRGHPVGVLAEDHEFILKAVENDTAFLNSINIVDYSMVMGLSYRQDNTGEKEEAPSEMTVGIIDYLRQFDLIKRVESVGKSVGMIAGQSSPTIIEPGLYGKRFRDAIHRYFMPVTPISSGTNDDK
ncbi:hypothetical protein JG688_00004165 [Phytophthora aleatoria]|uniref:PIPK domain-containing protein n=1 Tax=Phytophthora aleatoria TaxID=2496075 RepID=A0A8J5J263_9STRA|nr:hypothetical protein JG688_00004165 [Phytophthora aleatoria]